MALARHSSGHNPLLVTLQNSVFKTFPISFNVACSVTFNLKGLVFGCGGYPTFKDMLKLKLVKQAIRVWNKEVFWDAQFRIAGPKDNL